MKAKHEAPPMASNGLERLNWNISSFIKLSHAERERVNFNIVQSILDVSIQQRISFWSMYFLKL